MFTSFSVTENRRSAIKHTGDGAVINETTSAAAMEVPQPDESNAE